MITVRFHLCAVLACAILSVGAASAAEPEPTSADLDVYKVKAPDAMTIVRTMASANKVTVVDEDTIRVSGTPEILAMAAVVVELIEQPIDDGEPVVVREFADDTDIARIALKHVSLREAALALRGMRIRKYATQEQRQVILVRDTKEQVQAALDLIEALEQEASSR